MIFNESGFLTQRTRRTRRKAEVWFRADCHSGRRPGIQWNPYNKGHCFNAEVAKNAEEGLILWEGTVATKAISAVSRRDASLR